LASTAAKITIKEQGVESVMDKGDQNLQPKKIKGRQKRKSQSGDSSAESTIVEYCIGELVFAKIRGYGPWPARVSVTLEINLCKKYIVLNIFLLFSITLCKNNVNFETS